MELQVFSKSWILYHFHSYFIIYYCSVSIIVQPINFIIYSIIKKLKTWLVSVAFLDLPVKFWLHNLSLLKQENSSIFVL